MEEGAKRTIEIGVSCAAAGIIVGVLSLTGLGGKFSEVLINLTGGSLLLALIGTMVAAIILGTGLLTTAAYAIGASVLAPALIRLGALAVHMFLFYFSVISAVTPPVAFASFAAASIAKSPMWETSVESMRFGIAGYVVPFMFVYGSALLVGTTPWRETVLALFTRHARNTRPRRSDNRPSPPQGHGPRASSPAGRLTAPHQAGTWDGSDRYRPSRGSGRRAAVPAGPDPQPRAALVHKLSPEEIGR